MDDPTCRICGEKKSAHVATKKGPFTHPREARGEGTYELVASGTTTVGWYSSRIPEDVPYETYRFVPAAKVDK